MSAALMLAGFLATTNAGRLARAGDAAPRSRRAAAVALAAGAALAAVAALLADPLLDALGISPESFRIAAGLVLAVTGMVTMALPRVSAPVEMVLVTPELACMAIAAAASEGVGPALGAAAAALGAGALATFLAPRPAVGRAAPFLAALQVIVGVALVVGGVRDV